MSQSKQALFSLRIFRYLSRATEKEFSRVSLFFSHANAKIDVLEQATTASGSLDIINL
jgi:hypothetical protein